MDEVAEDEETIIERLSEKFEGEDSEIFDEAVIDAACSIASAVNNNGIDAQLEFLIQNGYTEAEIEALASG